MALVMALRGSMIVVMALRVSMIVVMALQGATTLVVDFRHVAFELHSTTVVVRTH
jgi:hypothetical protein